MPTKAELYNQGLDYFAQGKQDQAIEEFKKALAIDSRDAEIYMALSMSLQRRNDMESALEAAQKAVEYNPNEPLFYTNLSRIFVKLGQVPQAEEAMAMANQLSLRRS